MSLSQRAHAMPFAERDVEFHQIRFYHRGAFRLETELGPLEVADGDFVVIPKGLSDSVESGGSGRVRAVVDASDTFTGAVMADLWGFFAGESRNAGTRNQDAPECWPFPRPARLPTAGL